MLCRKRVLKRCSDVYAGQYRFKWFDDGAGKYKILFLCFDRSLVYGNHFEMNRTGLGIKCVKTACLCL